MAGKTRVCSARFRRGSILLAACALLSWAPVLRPSGGVPSLLVGTALAAPAGAALTTSTGAILAAPAGAILAAPAGAVSPSGKTSGHGSSTDGSSKKSSSKKGTNKKDAGKKGSKKSAPAPKGSGQKGSRGREAPAGTAQPAADTVKAPVAQTQPPAPLVAARALVDRDPTSAMVLLDKVLEDGGAAPFHAEAHALAGTALDSLQLPNLALMHLEQALATGSQVVEAGSQVAEAGALGTEAGALPPWFDTAFTTAARLARQTGQTSGLEAVCLRIDPDLVPASDRAYALYLAGRALEVADEPTRAIVPLTRLEPSDPYFVQARLVMANAFNRIRKRGLALATLQDLATTHAALLERSPRLEQVVALNRARAAYGAGQVEQAIALYGDIPRGSPDWLEAQQELAWAHYRQFAVSEELKALNAALGDLVTLNSPFFADRYLPEPALLEIQILYQLCRAVEGGRKLEAFLPRHTAWRDRLQAALSATAGRPGALLAEVLEARATRDGGPADALDDRATGSSAGIPAGGRLPAVFVDRFRNRPSLNDLEAALQAISEEKRRLEASERWAGTLHDRLAALLNAREATLRQTAELELRGELEAVLADLNDMLNQAQLARLNMVTAEKDLYEAAAAGTLPRTKKRRQRPWWLAAAADREVWPFEGEYWSDELGYYVGNATPQCPE